MGHHKRLKQKSQKLDTVTEMLNSSVKAKIPPPHPLFFFFNLEKKQHCQLISVLHNVWLSILQLPYVTPAMGVYNEKQKKLCLK